jgi:hypothetical protein
MTPSDKLAAILAAVQTDPGHRGLARDPHDNLFTATAGDFQKACRSLGRSHEDAVDITTGFFIPTASPPAYETDGPLGAVFLLRAMSLVLQQVAVWSLPACAGAVLAGVKSCSLSVQQIGTVGEGLHGQSVIQFGGWPGYPSTHLLAIEAVGRATDGRYYSMRGRDITEYTPPVDDAYLRPDNSGGTTTIGIGDGGNEIGMGKIPHETIVKNIPNGDLIHCRVPTDHLIVAGVSNWGAYALAAGVFVLKGVTPPPDLFDPDRELEILEVMVREGPLVDGVTGQQTATVDGLTWDEYVKPLIRIREILGA